MVIINCFWYVFNNKIVATGRFTSLTVKISQSIILNHLGKMIFSHH